MVRDLELDLDDYRQGRVLQPIHAFSVARMGDAPLRNDHGVAPVSYAIRRCEFDHYLLLRSGAELRTGSALESLQRSGNEWIVNGALRTPLLVGAGGHFCPVARGLYFCPDLAGYAWVVRKGDWLNVGIGRRGPRKLAGHFDRFLAAMVRDGVLEEEFVRARPSGHAYLLYPHAARPLVGDGAMLIGDAAGLAYPESGEGIRPAVESALLASEVIQTCGGNYSRQRLAGYARAIESRYGARTARAKENVPLPGRFKQLAAALLMRSHWFTREIVTRRWFLHEHVAPLAAH